jgi:AcrR family transcriptional regulator
MVAERFGVHQATIYRRWGGIPALVADLVEAGAGADISAAGHRHADRRPSCLRRRRKGPIRRGPGTVPVVVRRVTR